MVLLDSHLLIPSEHDYAPSFKQVLAFFEHLIEMGVLSSQHSIRLRVPSGQDLYARNPLTGEKILIGKRLDDVAVSEFAEIGPHIVGRDYYVLALDGGIPVSSAPFALYEKDGTRPDSARICRMHVTCLQRDCRTQLSEPWHEHLRTFLLPMEKAANACERCGAIHNPEEEVQPRFWIEFSFGDLFVPGLKVSPYPIKPELLAETERIFATTFFHGRFFN